MRRILCIRLAAMDSSPLLWIHNDDPARRTTHELSSTVRQHVMVNYHIKKAKRAQQTQANSKPLSADSQTKDTALRADHITVHPRTLCSSRAKQATRQVAYFPPPAPGLINDKDRSTYNAIWWHRYAAPASSDGLNWQEKCRADASQILWHVAKIDKTIFELFMCFSAAKEILVKGQAIRGLTTATKAEPLLPCRKTCIVSCITKLHVRKC